MDELSAIKALAGLAQASRLQAFRRLVPAGPGGMAAGDIARALGVPHNTLSAHLAILANAGLIASRREGRSVIYAVDYAGTRDLLAFLMEDCCRGEPAVCAPALDCVLPDCCAPAPRP